MARSTHQSSPLNPEEEHTSSRLQGGHDIAALSPSPAASFSSDKENRDSVSTFRRDGGKGRATMTSTATITPEPEERGPKRRKMKDRSEVEMDLGADDEVNGGLPSTRFYDPHQKIEDRRRLRKGLRDLTRDLKESKTDFVQPGSNGLLDTILKANSFMKEVKQTSDATLDSRLLVETADLSYKKTANLNLGNAIESVDVEEFVSKCISFMRTGSGSVQLHGARDRDDLEDDDGNAMDWARLGHHAAFPRNSRPPVPGFLLGPLSVQKRARIPRGKRASQRQTQTQIIRPEELKASDLEKKDNNNLTALCAKIRNTLATVSREGEEAVEREHRPDMSPAETKALMKRHNIADNGGINFFRFAINPRSFGQTVENLFYISFLIREAGVALAEDETGLPTLHASEAHSKEEIRDLGLQKYQAVFNLDYRTWNDLIDAFDIQESIIPDRDDDQSAVGARGWYG